MQCVYDRTCAMYIVHMQCVVAAAAAVALPKCNKLISFKRDFKWLYWSNDSLKTASTRTIRGSLVQMTRSSPRHLANSFATIINVYEELAVAAPFFWYEPRQVILSEGQVVGVFFIDLMYSRDVVASASFVLWVLISHCVLKTVLFFHITPLFFSCARCLSVRKSKTFTQLPQHTLCTDLSCGCVAKVFALSLELWARTAKHFFILSNTFH